MSLSGERGPTAIRPSVQQSHPDLYRSRNAIERCVGWLKGCRSIAIRHEKPAVNFGAMLKLAFLRQYLRTLRPSDRT